MSHVRAGEPAAPKCGIPDRSAEWYEGYSGAGGATTQSDLDPGVDYGAGRSALHPLIAVVRVFTGGLIRLGFIALAVSLRESHQMGRQPSARWLTMGRKRPGCRRSRKAGT